MLTPAGQEFTIASVILNQSLTTPASISTQRFKWWHGVAIFVAANAISFLPAGFNGDQAFYNNFRLPPAAPPDWLFPPVWFALNVTSLIALSRIANRGVALRERKVFLISEAAGWVLFAAFTAVYFGLKSPVLGAADTVLGLIAAGISTAFASKLDRTAALLILPRLLWLCHATYVSVYVSVVNSDPFLTCLRG